MIGKRPKWKPNTLGDMILFVILTLLYSIFVFPMYIVTKLFGKTKIDQILLDIISIPGKILLLLGLLFGPRGKSWGLKANAFYHIYFICRMCPKKRQATRDPVGKGICRWNDNWNKGRFNIVSDFGTLNFFKQYFNRQNLSKYLKLVDNKG